MTGAIRRTLTAAGAVPSMLMLIGAVPILLFLLLLSAANVTDGRPDSDNDQLLGTVQVSRQNVRKF